MFSELEKTEEKNTINDQYENNKINDNKGYNVNKDIHDNYKENNIINIKNKEIEELKKVIYNLQKKNEYDSERYKILLFYYEEFIKPTKKEKENNENENEKMENKINEKMENKVMEIENNKNENEIKENNNQINNELKENKIDKRYNSFLGLPNQIDKLEKSKTVILKKTMDINDAKIQNDKNLINENPIIKYKDIEFIHEKCLLCKKKCENKIYKDYKKNNIYLCENCYKKEIKSQYKEDYFEIKFPENILKLKEERKIRRKALGNKPIIDFNNFINQIFFDKEGNFSTKEINEINDKEFSELKRIYDDMILINENPVKYFADYQVSYINKQKMKMNDNDKKLIDKKLELFLVNLIKLQK